MGVYELHPASSPDMHWQQERSGMLAAPYDPSRDLSPNLPCQDTSSSSSSSSSSSTTSSSSCCKVEAPEPSPPPPPTPVGGAPLQHAQPPPAHHLNHGPAVCAGCNARITDRFYLFAVDRRWHASCLQCSQCRAPLDGEVTCFARDGGIYCKKDYYRLYGMRHCARCQATILSSELVMRARELVFHVSCFACAVCSTILTKGDTFGMRDGAVFCRLHYMELPPAESPNPYHHPPPPHHSLHPAPDPYHHPSQPPHHPRLTPPIPPQDPPPSGPPPPGPPHHPTFFNGAPTPAPPPRQKGRPRKRKPKDLDGITTSLGGLGMHDSFWNSSDLTTDPSGAYLDSVGFGPGTPGMGANGGHQRTKRMRTSFKHHQLRTMKSYFAINHNPDAKDLKQLSQKTGLPKRVLQVWFQNARAKWRRMVLKQEGVGGGKGDKCEGGSGLEGYHHGSVGQMPSPQHYLSSSPLECSS